MKHDFNFSIFSKILPVIKVIPALYYMITEKINEVYEKIDQTEFEPYLTAGLEPLRNITKNDTW